MAELIVREWLADCKALSPSEARSFTSTTVQNNDLVQGIFSVFEEKSKNHDVLEGVCNQLFSFYRSRDVELQRFALQYLPAMITACLCSLAQGDKKNVKCIEVLLLGIYNLEVVDAKGKPKIHSFRMPSIAQPSIYHLPISLASAASATLTENSLSRLEKGDSQVIAIGPFNQVESLNAQNRMQVMTVLMNLYNRNLSFLRKSSLHSLCKMCTRLTRQGFGKQANHHRASYSNETIFGNPYSKPLVCRIPLNSSLLLEILHGVYFSMFNGLGSIGLQALDDLHNRASQELMADVLLVTNGVRNSFHTRPSGQANDGPMGISISISPSTSLTTVSKSIITNASFRTKKLPDDIPIQNSANKEGESSDAHQKSLATISEEMEEGGEGKQQQHGKGKEKEKGKAPLERMISIIGGGGKGKDKDKEKEKEKEKDKSTATAIGAVSETSTDGRKKDGADVSPAAAVLSNKGSGRRGNSPIIAKSVVQNGDSSAHQKLSPRDSQGFDIIEMKTLNVGARTPSVEVRDRGKYNSTSDGLDNRHHGERDEEEDEDEEEEEEDEMEESQSKRSSLIVSNSTSRAEDNEDKETKPFHASGENAIIAKASRTEIHTTV